MEKVTGLGGFFFKAKNPKTLGKWYSKHLGISLHKSYGGFTFNWRHIDEPEQTGYTVWSPFDEDTKYFNPSEKQFMFNFRVADLKSLLKQLEKEGVKQVGETEEYEYGKFAWILDLEGNKIELWEPVKNTE